MVNPLRSLASPFRMATGREQGVRKIGKQETHIIPALASIGLNLKHYPRQASVLSVSPASAWLSFSDHEP